MENQKMTLAEFQQLINQEPDPAILQPHPQAKDVQTLPISFLEMKLDELFAGLWSVEREQSQVVANELCVSLELKYYHPVLEQWITRVGVGAVPILQNRGAAVNDIGAKKKNALQMNYPAAKSFAFKNACKSIGKLFGRDLNRNNFAEMLPLETQLAIQGKSNQDVYKLIEAADFDALPSLYNEYSNMPEVMERIAARRKQLQPEQLPA